MRGIPRCSYAKKKKKKKKKLMNSAVFATYIICASPIVEASLQDLGDLGITATPESTTKTTTLAVNL